MRMYILFVLYPDELNTELKRRTVPIAYDEAGKETSDSKNERWMYSILDEEAMEKTNMGRHIYFFGGIVAVILSVIAIVKKMPCVGLLSVFLS